MTIILGADPGLNTGLALGTYDALTPYRQLRRWQVHHGLEGFLRWQEAYDGPLPDEVVVEKFLSSPEELADLSGVPIEGALALWARQIGATVIWQNRTHKGALVGYPPEAVTKAQRQRVRFDWLAERGLALAGTENDDSNDAVSHNLISLKSRRHLPTIKMYWG